MEVINFKSFMKGNSRKEVKLHSFTFNPMLLMDPVILTIGGVMLGIVVVEKILVMSGHEDIANWISNTLKVAVPVMIIGAFFIFLISNPILSWL